MHIISRSFGMRRTLALIMLVSAAASSTSCVSDRTSGDEGPIAPTPGPDGVVEIRLTENLRFDPADIVIPRGTTVRWINAAAIFHTITPDNASQSGVWTRRTISGAGETFTHSFGAAGQTYTYHCEPHVPQE
jgi:plastocyanin